MTKGTCSAEDTGKRSATGTGKPCGLPVFARGWCRKHWRRWRNTGDPLGLPPRIPVDVRFWAKVDKSDGCWTWTAATDDFGYGSFWDGTHRPTGSPRMVKAHRWAYERFVGPIPDGFEVCHRCDNPPCVNYTRCLFVGTHQDNMTDMKVKGRGNGVMNPAGEAHRMARLTQAQVDEIRRRSTGQRGEQRRLAEEYGVGRRQIGKIISGQRWAS